MPNVVSWQPLPALQTSLVSGCRFFYDVTARLSLDPADGTVQSTINDEIADVAKDATSVAAGGRIYTITEDGRTFAELRSNAVAVDAVYAITNPFSGATVSALTTFMLWRHTAGNPAASKATFEVGDITDAAGVAVSLSHTKLQLRSLTDFYSIETRDSMSTAFGDTKAMAIMTLPSNFTRGVVLDKSASLASSLTQTGSPPTPALNADGVLTVGLASAEYPALIALGVWTRVLTSDEQRALRQYAKWLAGVF